MVDEVEREKTPQEQLNEARSIRQKMLRLAENGDYKYLFSVMQLRLDNMAAASFARPNGLDGVITNIYAQGEVSGFNTAMGFLKLLLSAQDETIAAYAHLDKEDDEL